MTDATKDSGNVACVDVRVYAGFGKENAVQNAFIEDRASYFAVVPNACSALTVRT